MLHIVAEQVVVGRHILVQRILVCGKLVVKRVLVMDAHGQAHLEEVGRF